MQGDANSQSYGSLGFRVDLCVPLPGTVTFLFIRRGPSVEIGIVRVMSAKMVVACIIE